jgi:hypothetical protein
MPKQVYIWPTHRVVQADTPHQSTGQRTRHGSGVRTVAWFTSTRTTVGMGADARFGVGATGHEYPTQRHGFSLRASCAPLIYRSAKSGGPRLDLGLFHDSTGIHFLERRECFALPFLGKLLRQVRSHNPGGHGVVTLG